VALRMIGSVPRNLPSGTVTFLFTDVEGSTRLLHALGPAAYATALAEHRRIIRDAIARHGGCEVDTQGDALFVAFPTAPGALAAAREATAALEPGPIRVRIGLHTGTPLLTDEGYVGADVHKGARIAAAGHGGQVLVSAATAALVDDELTDLGAHRLKDLTAPERIFQADAGDHPPLKTLHQTNLPVPATPFLGRDAELSEIGALIAREGVRLVTLTGPGGTGKTRLALQAAANAAERHPAGVWWVPLAALRDPALVLPAAAQALGAAGELAEHIGDKKLLLVLDNFEHLISAAADLSPVLAACPNLTLLVTSREPLHLAGEHEYAVDPLRQAEAVELFLTRAVAVNRDFAADGEVARICERLDHLPLAIELAAARVKHLGPSVLLERLEQRLPLLTGGSRDAPDRQRTLRATIEWSHELLTSAEQQLFARLAVFRGGCTLEAAEAVVDADLDTLGSLVDKSLVRVRDTGRFWMLETIREFAVERLIASGEADALRRRHAEFFLALGRSLPTHVPVTADWLDAVQVEHDNVRAALDHLPAQGDTQAALELAESIWRFWKVRGHPAEAWQRLEALLAADPTPTPARGHALNAIVGFGVEGTSDTASPEAARAYAEEALALHRANDDAWGIARATYMLGYVAIETGDFERALPLFEESLRLVTDLGHEHYIGLATFNLAWAAEELGDVGRARDLHVENLRRARSTGNPALEAMALDAVAGDAHDEGRLEEALELKRQSLRISRDLGDAVHTLDSLSRVALTQAALGRASLAAELLSASLALHEEAGLPLPLYQQRRRDDTLAEVDRQLSAAEREEAWQRGKTCTLDEAVHLALAD
jgi:predicted ATPase/class 3 adenylate cyclase